MHRNDVRHLIILAIVLAWFMVGTNYLSWWLTLLIAFPIGFVVGLLVRAIDRWLDH